MSNNIKYDRPGSTKANGREAKTCLGRVFNYKLSCFNDVNVFVYVDACPHLQLKTWPRFSPISLSLPMDRLIMDYSHAGIISHQGSLYLYTVLSMVSTRKPIVLN
jgi:hypothetical protein